MSLSISLSRSAASSSSASASAITFQSEMPLWRSATSRRFRQPIDRSPSHPACQTEDEPFRPTSVLSGVKYLHYNFISSQVRYNEFHGKHRDNYRPIYHKTRSDHGDNRRCIVTDSKGFSEWRVIRRQHQTMLGRKVERTYQSQISQRS